MPEGNSVRTIDFDSMATGDDLAAVGTEPMYHHRTQTAYGPPTVANLSAVYPNEKTVRIHNAGKWNGTEIVAAHVTSDLRLDIWFGDPFNGGTRQQFDINGTGGRFDLLAAAPITGWQFRPERLYIVGERLIAFCSVRQDSVSRINKLAFLSAAMSDIQSGVAQPWTVHFVTNEYSAAADLCGGYWACSVPQLIGGAFWSIACDYDSSTKAGGQAFIVKISTAGVPQGVVRLNSNSGSSNEHWHGGCILQKGGLVYALWHVGDAPRRLEYRTIADLANFDANATEDTSSGIAGSYRVKNVSETDWSAVSVAAGVDKATTLVNSRWTNAFILGTDPLDPAKWYHGGDTTAGLINRGSLDSNGIAVYEGVFAGMAKNTPMVANAAVLQPSVFAWAVNGPTIAAVVANELDQGSNATWFSGILLSRDSGQTWGWIWKGTASVGAVPLDGLVVLDDGSVLLGTMGTARSMLRITPGASVAGKPLFVGYRPTNLLSNIAGLGAGGILTNGGGTIVAAHGSPELALPSILHGDNTFQLTRLDTSAIGTLEIVDQGLADAAWKAGNVYCRAWMRKRDPTGTGEAQRTQVDVRLGVAAPGYSSLGASVAIYSPLAQLVTREWQPVTINHDGSGITGTPSTDPSDLRLIVRGKDIATSSAGNTELFFECVVLDRDRPPLPYPVRTLSGVSAGKMAGLGLGTAWSVLAVLQVPEECWDAFSTDDNNTWASAVPVLSVADAGDTNHVSVRGRMTSGSIGGSGIALVAPDFDWEIVDSDSDTPTDIPDYPARTVPVVVALSKDGPGALQYAIAGPAGIASGTRAMAREIDADTLRLCDVAETDALEMYTLRLSADEHARSAAELVGVVRALELDDRSDPGELLDSGGGNLTRPFPRERLL